MREIIFARASGRDAPALAHIHGTRCLHGRAHGVARVLHDAQAISGR